MGVLQSFCIWTRTALARLLIWLIDGRLRQVALGGKLGTLLWQGVVAAFFPMGRFNQ